MKEYATIIDSPIGKLGGVTTAEALLRVEFLSNDEKKISAIEPLAKTVVSQLKSYFKDPKFVFDLPLDMIGRPFQKSVWCALRKIPVGNTKTYSELSDELASGPRAVGNACRHNPLPIVIPCHRIVAKNGLGGFSGETSGQKMTIKQWLLKHERRGQVFN